MHKHDRETHRVRPWIGLLALIWSACLLAAAESSSPRVPRAPEAVRAGSQHPHPDGHVLRPNDAVLVRVYQEDDLSTQAQVRQDGTIVLPLLGVVTVGRQTVEQARRQIQDALAADYLVNPQVSLSVVEYARGRFTVLGQAQHPGTFDMPVDEPMTLAGAVAMAGGYTRLANPARILVRRLTQDHETILRFDGRLTKKGKSDATAEIFPNDIITVGERWF
jgi:protein involved in polysaccharide export with SLBB domain